MCLHFCVGPWSCLVKNVPTVLYGLMKLAREYVPRVLHGLMAHGLSDKNVPIFLCGPMELSNKNVPTVLYGLMKLARKYVPRVLHGLMGCLVKCAYISLWAHGAL